MELTVKNLSIYTKEVIGLLVSCIVSKTCGKSLTSDFLRLYFFVYHALCPFYLCLQILTFVCIFWCN